jgi:hypothetical protein
MLRAVLLVCFLAFIAIGGFFGYRKFFSGPWEQLADELPAALAEAKAAGVPLEPEDLHLDVPDEDNAAPGYRLAIAKLKVIGSTTQMQKDLEKAAYSRQSYDRMTADRAVSSLKLAVASAISATKKPRLSFERNWREGGWMMLPEYAPIKTLAKLMLAEARYADSKGDVGRALELAGAVDQMPGHLQQEPILISYLVGLAIEMISNRTYEILLSSHVGNPAILQKILTQIDKRPPVPQFRNALGGEVLMSRFTLHKLKSFSELTALASGAPAPSSPAPPGLTFTETQKNAFETNVMRTWAKFYKEVASTKDPRTLGRKFDDYVNSIDSKDPTQQYNAVVFPIFSQAADAQTRLDIGRKMILFKAKILVFKAQHGRYPRKLEEVGKPPIDPFSGKPLVYQVTPTGFLLYSFGIDGKDNGGIFGLVGSRDDTVEHPISLSKIVPK